MSASTSALAFVQRLSRWPIARWPLDWRRFWRTLVAGARRRVSPAALGVTLACSALLALSSGYRYETFDAAYRHVVTSAAAAAASGAGADQLQREHERLLRAVSGSAPRGTYIVVDRVNNRVYLRRQDRVLLTATASTGSGFVLREEKGHRRTWVFDTPQGAFKVMALAEDPVWKKPDWAFVEEGRPIPADPGERLEYGTLGEYALYFGDGYMIHGTLYERLLGRSVTHGCIRLGREDLRKVYRAASLGTPIYVF